MNIGKLVYSLLSNYSAVSTAVTSGGLTRITASIMAQDVAMPFITYQTISINPNDTKDGVSQFDQYRVQVNVVYAYGSNAYDTAQTLAENVRLCLDRATPGTYNGVQLHNSTFINQRDDFSLSSSERGAFMITQDYYFWIYR